MGSDVVLNNPYLDNYLGFGWYLNIIMLLLLGDAPLICGSDSAVDMDDWDYTFDYEWFDVVWFSNLSHILCHTRAYFLFGWDLYIFTGSHEPHHLRDAYRVDDLLLSCHDPPVESLLGHLVKLILLIFRCHHASSYGRCLLVFRSNSIVDMDD